jgi:enoyl-CoA hydratase
MTVRTEQDAAVLVVTIDRPEVRNAVDRATAEELAEAFCSFDATVRLPRLIGESGPSTWCSPDARSARRRRSGSGWSTGSASRGRRCRTR